MSKFILIASLFFLSSARPVESIYTHSVTSIEGDNMPLAAYEGKKLLIITLPIQQSAPNDSLLHSLDSLSGLYSASLKIIAVPSFEDGYTVALRAGLTQWYRSILSPDVLVTEGVYTRKTSGSQQHPLFKWLCSKEKNGHFNNDVAGPAYKFVVWNNGELTGVLESLTRIKSNALNDLLETQ